jgi:hypothetical protein
LGVERIVDVCCTARRAGCKSGGGLASGMVVDNIVEVGSRARRPGCRRGRG